MATTVHWTAVLGLMISASVFAASASDDRLACEAGDQSACTSLGVRFDTGDGVREDSERALEILDAACRNGNADGCAEHATLVRDGRGTRRNLPRAARAFEKACDDGSQIGCTRYAGMLRAGRGNLVPNPVQAFALAAQACGAGVEEGCMHVATHLMGDSPEKAEKLAKDSCNRKYAPACEWLGAQLARGFSFGRRPSDAFVYLQSSCTSGQPTSCRILGDAYGSDAVPGLDLTRDAIRAESMWAQALTGLERNCERGHGDACLELSDMYASGRGASPNAEQQVNLVRTACKTEHAGACLQMGEMYRVGDAELIVDHELAARWYANACDFGQTQGCRLAAAMLTSRLMALGPVLWDETADLERVMALANKHLDGPLAGEMHAAIGSGHLFLGDNDEAVEAFRAASTVFAAQDPTVQLPTKLGMACALDGQGKWSAAAAAYRDFLDSARKSPEARVSADEVLQTGSAVDWATTRLTSLQSKAKVD